MEGLHRKSLLSRLALLLLFLSPSYSPFAASQTDPAFLPHDYASDLPTATRSFLQSGLSSQRPEYSITPSQTPLVVSSRANEELGERGDGALPGSQRRLSMGDDDVFEAEPPRNPPPAGGDGTSLPTSSSVSPEGRGDPFDPADYSSLFADTTPPGGSPPGLFEYFLGGNGEELLKCASWKAPEKWGRLTRSFCRRFRRRPHIHRVCEEAAEQLVTALSFHTLGGPNPVPDVLKKLTLRVTHPLVYSGGLLATIPNTRDLFLAAATGDARIFRDKLKGRSCEITRILEKFERKTTRERRRARGSEYKTRSSRVREASRLVLLLEHDPTADGMMIGLLVNLIDMSKCRGNRLPREVSIQAGGKSFQLKGIDLAQYALGAAISYAYFARDEDCGPTRSTPNCTTLKSVIQARELLSEQAGEILFSAASGRVLENYLQDRRGLPAVPEMRVQSETQYAMTMIRLQIMYGTKLAVSSQGKAVTILAFFARVKLVARIISKLGLLFNQTWRQYVGEASAPSPPDSLPEMNEAIQDLQEVSSAATIYCSTGRSGLENLAISSLKRILKEADRQQSRAAATAGASGGDSSTVSLVSLKQHSQLLMPRSEEGDHESEDYNTDLSSSPALNGKEYMSLVSFADKTPLLGGEADPGDSRRPSSSSSDSDGSGGRSSASSLLFERKRVKDKTWSRIKPMHILGAVMLLAVGVGATVGAVVGAILPLAVVLAIVSIFSFLGVSYFLMLVFTRRTVLRNVKKGAVWVTRAEERERQRRQQAEKRAQELLQRLEEQAQLDGSSSESETDSDTD
ncbi:transmembrane protein [Cystoisospora suis]|uniref:Transmembrane protein n=1 Tax=Cystoisospora suis TaxID=483139 RepID=A0A2C6KZE3_9APIC|nr:transmembrane protein [Cystoisospora suis]